MRKFSEFYKKILEELETVASVYGTTGDTYAPGDARIPKVLGKKKRKILRRTIKESAETNVFYHGCSLSQANILKETGFGKSEKGKGMSNTPSDLTFLALTKKAALWYATQNIKFSDGAIIKCTYPANIWNASKANNDMSAFNQATIEFNIPYARQEGKLLDIPSIQTEMIKRGYNAIRFKDRLSGNFHAIIALEPEKISINKIFPVNI